MGEFAEEDFFSNAIHESEMYCKRRKFMINLRMINKRLDDIVKRQKAHYEKWRIERDIKAGILPP